jgi:hypothetical protein
MAVRLFLSPKATAAEEKEVRPAGGKVEFFRYREGKQKPVNKRKNRRLDMKKIALALAIVFAFTSVSFAAFTPVTKTGTVTVTVEGSALFSIAAFKVLPSLTGGQDTIISSNLNGDMDFGTVKTDPASVLDPTTNPYGVGVARVGSSHYAQIRFYCNNNIDRYQVTMNLSGPMFTNIVVPTGSTSPTILHFACVDMEGIGETGQVTQDNTNLNWEASDGASVAGLYDLYPNTDYVLYDTKGNAMSDMFVAFVFMNNVSPGVYSGTYTGTATYTMSQM